MKTMAFIITYIGAFPEYFPLWLQSCADNPTVDFLLFTDNNTEYDYPPNVKRYLYSFTELKEKIAQHFDFPIRLEKPYKLCDYRPAYGEIFADYLIGYDWWGFCDIDIIWGNIRRFFTDEHLGEKWTRLLGCGHCSVFRNTEAVCSYYRTLPNKGHLDYKSVYTSDESWCFDEWGEHRGGGTSIIFRENHIPIYNEPVMANLGPDSGRFIIPNRPDLQHIQYIEYKDGNLYVHGIRDGEAYCEDILYVHLFRRKVNVDSKLSKRNYKIVPPNRIIAVEKHDLKIKSGCLILIYDIKLMAKRIREKLSAN